MNSTSASAGVCIVGHLTRDVMRHRSRDREAPGGVPLYVGRALLALGVDTAILTKLATADGELLGPLRQAGAVVDALSSAQTHTFENRLSDDQGTRTQRMLACADPFDEADVAGVSARLVHLGPLLASDLPVSVIEELASRAEIVSADAQGWTRVRDGDAVRAQPWPELAEALRFVHILQLNRQEAQILTGETEPERAAAKLAKLGPREVVVTLDAFGVFVLADGVSGHVDALEPARTLDSTGAGDSFAAGYLCARLRGEQPLDSARFGTAVASLAIEARGAFVGPESAVRARLASRAH